MAHNNTTFRAKYILLLLYISLINLAVCSETFENISDCRISDDIYVNLNVRSVTFTCAEINNEEKIFAKSAPTYLLCEKTERLYFSREQINFENCRFLEIKRTILNGLQDFGAFNASNVDLQTIHSDEFRNVTYMRSLILSNNHLVKFPHLQLSPKNILKVIDLSNNIIDKIHPLAFNDAKHLEELHLSHNALTKLDAQMFETIPTLKTLNVSHNRIKELDLHLLPRSLIILDLSFNRLTAFNSCQHLNDLKHLDLSHNSVSELQVDSFSYLWKLEHLKLRKTNISHIEFGTFSHQQNLITLDLSGNELKVLDFVLFFPILHDLTTLDLADNRLTELLNFRNSLVPQLTLLNINNNAFNCSYLESFMESVDWSKLRLSIDALANPSESNIKGIKCEENNSYNDQDNLFDNNSTKYLQYRTKLVQRILDRVLIIKICMYFLCIAIALSFVIFLSKNGSQIYMKISRAIRIFLWKRKQSSTGKQTESSNEEMTVKKTEEI